MNDPKPDLQAHETGSIDETPAACERHNYYARLKLRPYRVTGSEVAEAAVKERERLVAAAAEESLNENLQQALDDVLAAEICLCDPVRKRTYDLDLQRFEIVQPARREIGTSHQGSSRWSSSHRQNEFQNRQGDLSNGVGNASARPYANRSHSSPASMAAVVDEVSPATNRRNRRSSVPEPCDPVTQRSPKPIYRIESNAELAQRKAQTRRQRPDHYGIPDSTGRGSARQSGFLLAALAGALVVPLVWMAFSRTPSVVTNLEIDTNPAGCTVTLDGRRLGITSPANVPLAAGIHQLHIAKDGFRPCEVSLDLDGRQGIHRKVFDLTPIVTEISQVTIETNPAGARIEIDGKPAEKQTPLTISTSYGPHQIALSLAGHERRVVDIDVRKPKQSETFALERKNLEVSVTSEPSGASVVFDGRKLPGLTPLIVNAPLGPHTVELELEGFERIQQTVDASEGQQKLKYSFVKLPVKNSASAAAVVDPTPGSAALAISTGPSSLNTPNAGPVAQDAPSGPVIYRPQFDVQGKGLSESEKMRYVRDVREILGGRAWPKGEVHFVASVSGRIDDSRLIYAQGLLCEKRHEIDQALEWYRWATNFDCPYYAPWHRLIHLELRRGDDERALKDCRLLIQRTVKDASRSTAEFDSGKALAENLEFAGGILGFLSVNTSKILPIPEVEAEINYLIAGGAGKSSTATRLDSAAQEVRERFLVLSQSEDAINAERRDAATGKDMKEIQGEKEIRTTRGEHFSKDPLPPTLPNRMADFYQLSPDLLDSRRWYEHTGIPGRVIRTTDKFFRINEYHLKDEPRYRHATKFSKMLKSYLPDSIELDRDLLLETFPDDYRVSRTSDIGL